MLNESELRARYVSYAEQYAKLINIEANTMSYMVRHMYLPALIDYSGDIAAGVATKMDLGLKARAEKDMIVRLTDGIDLIYDAVDELEQLNAQAGAISNVAEQDNAYRDTVLPAMSRLRDAVDTMEQLCSHDFWPVPSYNKMLFYI